MEVKMFIQPGKFKTEVITNETNLNSLIKLDPIPIIEDNFEVFNDALFSDLIRNYDNYKIKWHSRVNEKTGHIYICCKRNMTERVYRTMGKIRNIKLSDFPNVNESGFMESLYNVNNNQKKYDFFCFLTLKDLDKIETFFYVILGNNNIINFNRIIEKEKRISNQLNRGDYNPYTRERKSKLKVK